MKYANCLLARYVLHRHNRFLRWYHLNDMLVTATKSANTYKFESGVRKASSTQTINEGAIAAQCPFTCLHTPT